MSFNTLSNELILHLAHFLPNPSLNSLIQTHQRTAILLTPHLYNPSILFQPEKEESRPPSPSDSYSNPDHPTPLRCLDCAPRWTSHLILSYFHSRPSAQYTLVDIHKRTLLHHIAAQGNPLVLEILLSKGADIEARDPQGNTPLIAAAVKRGNEPVLRALLQAGADPRAVSNTNITALVQAIFSKSLSSVQCVLEALESKSGVDGLGIWAPLTSGEVMHRAIYIGSAPIMKVLLERGADFQAVNVHGNTCVNAAVIRGCGDVVDLLLDWGADVLPGDDIGRTVVTEMGAQLGANRMRRIVRAFVEAGGDVSVGLENVPLLHYHAARGSLMCVEVLLDTCKGGDLFKDSVNGATPLMCALLYYGRNTGEEFDSEGVCRVLIKAMASAREGEGHGKVNVFAANTMTDMVEWEPQRKVLGMTALHLAAEEGIECVVLLLIENGADVLVVDDYGRTPLLCALLNEYEDICLILGKEMRIRGHDFAAPVSISSEAVVVVQTLLELARNRKMDRLVSFLTQNGG
ncbi:ankyrin repeat-containing domain protein [Rhexocercosporidium sp. MPI-PUGE-AT-0058]|nr:ankyrin repeat-containing domain protein [Rhexocercosporidium sp. MPI-PUGE-AT-0058]